MITTDLRDFIAAHTREIQIEIGVALITLCGPEPEEALSALSRARTATDKLEARLIAEGFDMNLGSKTEWFSLTSLAMLSSAKSVALLAGIDALIPIAEELDAERGMVLPKGYQPGTGESWGTDYAEVLATMRIRLLSEVSGVRGSGRE